MSSAVTGTAGAVVASAVLDAVLAEPPAAAHPVVWAGRWLRRAEAFVPAGPPHRAFLAGAAGWGVAAAAACAAGGAWAAAVGRVPPWGRPVAEGVALWPLWSARLLLSEVAAVEAALGRDASAGRAGPVEGRSAVARIVSRDVGALDAEGVRAAALESLAENLSDSVVAPLFWYAVAGLPGAAAYRFVNTADACWGYRTPRWRYAGRVAARADDVANLVPARVTAALLAAGASTATWRRLAAEARRTPSPNAGWPMAALALRLDRRLGKDGWYCLNAGAAAPEPRDTTRALAWAERVVAVAVAGAEAVVLLRAGRRTRGTSCRP